MYPLLRARPPRQPRRDRRTRAPRSGRSRRAPPPSRGAGAPQIGGTFMMGSNRPALSGRWRRSGAPGDALALRHRLPRRQQSAVRRLRPRHRLHDRRRTLRLELCVRRTAAGRHQARASAAARRKRRGGFRCRTPIGRSRKDRRAPSSTGSIIPSCMSHGTMRKPIAAGRTHACRPKPNGKWPRAAVWKQATYPWGDELTPDGEHRCNIWQGNFPDRNTADDGYAGHRAGPCLQAEWLWPAQHRRKCLGMVRGLFSPTITASRRSRSRSTREPAANRSLRGGSFLCHESYCNRYRVAARSSNTPDTSTSNIGFRVVRLDMEC